MSEVLSLILTEQGKIVALFQRKFDFPHQEGSECHLVPLSWTPVIYFTFGVEFASLLLHQLCFSSLSREFPHVLEQIQGQLGCDRGEYVGEQLCSLTSLGCTGRVQRPMEKAFYHPFFFPTQVEGIFSVSHKSRLCGSAFKDTCGSKITTKINQVRRKPGPSGSK